MAGIHSYAVQLPRLAVRAEDYRQALGRCAARIEAKRVADHDEDEATLAIAAGRALLALEGPPPSMLVTASAGAPPFGALVAEALALQGGRVAELRGPTAGVQALLAAQDAVAQGHGCVVVVSSDAPRFGPDDDREHGAGAGAVALRVTAKGPVQVRRVASAAVPDLEPGAPRADVALAQALAQLTRSGLAADSVARVATQDLDASLAKAAQRALPKAKLAQPSLQAGDLAATAPLLALARALEESQAGEVVVLAAAGAGLALAAALEVERTLPAATLAQALARAPEPLDHARLARLRGWLSAPRPDVSQGAAVSPAQYAESLPARLRFEGQRCKGCSRALFPPREACHHCGDARLEPLRLGGKGTVHSAATIGRGAAPAEFAEQQRRTGAYDVAVVELAEGPRVTAQVCDAAPGQARIGAPVELVVRRLYTQEGQARYGFKARLASG